MRSFAVWYDGKGHNETVKADFHVNYWSKLPYKKDKMFFFDFGIKVEGISLVKNINVYCPFNLEINDIKDLGGKISNEILVNAVFNENYKVENGVPKHCVVKGKDETSFIIYALNETDDITLCQFKRSKYLVDNPAANQKSPGTLITVKTDNILIGTDEKTKDIDNYYFRFRVAVDENNLKNITEEVENINIFKDAIEAMELLDFRVNDIRSCCEDVKARFNSGDKFFLKSIHFLVMRDVNDLVMVDGCRYSCRLMEQDIWRQYIDNLEPNVVAYHFKRKCKPNISVDGISLLIKFRFRKYKIKQILIYLTITWGIGLFINWSFKRICELLGGGE